MSRIHTLAAFTAVSLLAIGSATQAWADPPAATVSGNSQSSQDSFQINIFHAPGTVTSTAPGPVDISSSVTTSLGGTTDLGGHPGVILHSAVTWPGGVGATAFTQNVANMDYYFEIKGPAGKAALRYDASAMFTASQLFRGENYGVDFNVEVGPQGAPTFADVLAFTGTAIGQGTDPYVPDPLLGSSYLIVSANPNGPHAPSAPFVDCPAEGCSQSVHLSGSALFTTNVVYDVHINAGTNLTVSGPPADGAASLDATVDPIFEIDPNGPDAGLYSLTFSPGVVADTGFPTGVPEPATWALLLLGAGGLGARLRWARSRQRERSLRLA